MRSLSSVQTKCLLLCLARVKYSDAQKNSFTGLLVKAAKRPLQYYVVDRLRSPWWHFRWPWEQHYGIGGSHYPGSRPVRHAKSTKGDKPVERERWCDGRMISLVLDVAISSFARRAQSLASVASLDPVSTPFLLENYPNSSLVTL